LDFPALNDMITMQFYSHGKTIPEVADKLNVFKRQLFMSWKAKAYAMFENTGLFGSETRSEEFDAELEDAVNETSASRFDIGETESDG
jgi:hypothetical protein